MFSLAKLASVLIKSKLSTGYYLTDMFYFTFPCQVYMPEK